MTANSPPATVAARHRSEAAGAALGVAGALAVAITLALMLPQAARAADATPAAAPVGQISLLIGEARVVRADGTREALRRGMAILVGDRLETAANGHVHVRFVDNGAVSVRPESVLEVQAYRYDPQHPQSNEIRLRVEQGTSRSISGAATDQDKTRFRLNTPIAAIGVRGTDFIVQTDTTGVRATVADGAIVVGALGAGCSAAGLGPCAGDASRVLSAGMGRLMAEVRTGDSMARIVPAAGAVLASSAFSPEERVAARHMAETTARTAGQLAAEPTAAALLRGNDRAAAALLNVASVNVAESEALRNNLNRPADAGAQLVWGRWSVAPLSDDRVSVPYAFARLDRHITVSDGEAGLFRANATQPGPLLSDSLNAKVDFNLTRASATYESGGRTEAAAVNGALSIDFARRSFATALAMSSLTGGSSKLLMAGDLRNDGLFALTDGKAGTDSYQRIGGAVSLDGKEAGYFFERDTATGIFRGRTLWGAPVPGR